MAAASGTLVGIGGTLALYPTRHQLSAAIASEPALCAQLAAAGLESPSPPDEALEAFRRAKKTDQATLRLGECSKNTMGPGVQCTVKYELRTAWKDEGDGVVAFSRGRDGWQAVQLP
ncbi:MAG: hypothetical protein E5V66_13955 [Mesorhizobium sp.]|uniref:hypothetical protein n=1 Tax=unclassified Mesorhizobium TaxID=325217 RepID=UPI000FC9F079|nr:MULTISPECIES: hypothetical protein [unclassified Mesorhizobium]RUW75113.1 hypothetical protein EOA29_29760 [Mesorhizobium sp. M1E.F.Ca.ET.063.01.1.1]TIW11348.1 MAG: hypothetical protein E5V66_13955 [Mesorhizobium sp.]